MSNALAASTTDATRLDAKSLPPTEIVSLRHPFRTLSAVILLFLILCFAYSVVTNENYEWDIVASYLFDDRILTGLWRTLILTAFAMSAGILLGIVIATCRLSENKVLSTCANAYLWFFRGTPLLIQLIFWFNLAALYPRIGLVLPFGGPEILGFDSNTVLTVWVVALLGLSLNEAAYMAEIIRGGLLAVSKHQTEAARALGMSQSLSFRRIILPQALRVIVPPTGNQVIGMLKYSTLVSIIALPDLLYSAQLIYSQNFQTIPLLIVVSIWYLLCTTVLTVIQRYIEKYYGRGMQPSSPTAPKSRKQARIRGRGSVAPQQSPYSATKVEP
ncbi:amino acid ABC transporter permease [Rhodococcoides kyotonense]|uniref:Polar amino acid transport system permease protein n=1 Tax=Rhodococcoides kyotonense TaxID=398843 RepID=A0A239LZ90_9NOCA|nr:amino acid ABC transporter permease [Rhodococcus kyotonensis]SNT35600.1 polar amino acid transport system permease protein [Rhodococcus kyotonensis]